MEEHRARSREQSAERMGQRVAGFYFGFWIACCVLRVVSLVLRDTRYWIADFGFWPPARRDHRGLRHGGILDFGLEVQRAKGKKRFNFGLGIADLKSKG